MQKFCARGVSRTAGPNSTHLNVEVITQRVLHRLDEVGHEVLALVVGLADEFGDAAVLRGEAVEEVAVAEIVSAIGGEHSELLGELHEDRREVIECDAATELLGELDDVSLTRSLRRDAYGIAKPLANA